MSQKQVNSSKDFVIHDYDKRIARKLAAIEREFSEENIRILKKYDAELVKQSLAKATRLKQLEVILNLRIKHIKFDNIGAVIHVDGKTGARPIRIIRSVPNLAKWLDVHPMKDNPDAPVWIMLDKRNLGQPLDYAGARAMLQRRREKANLAKPVNLKLFRHSEATQSANFMTEAQMRIRHGWTPTSKMR